MNTQQIGIIDMGSNSIRFVVYAIDESGCVIETQNLKIVARLSTYINAQGAMTLDGIDIIVQTLHRFSQVMKQLHLTSIRCVATAAIRNATNREQILKTIQRDSDFSIEILSEQDEAYFGYLAISNSTNIQCGITIDIGGGSTEITLFENRKLIHFHSFPFGALTLKKNFIDDVQPTKKEMERLIHFLRKNFSHLPWLKDKLLPIIGIGGSARNLALVHQQQINYPIAGLHQYEMSKDNVHFINKMLIDIGFKERQQLEGLSKDRADIIIPAITAIEQLINIVGSKELIVSSKGLRDGLFYEIYLSPFGIEQFPNVAEESFYLLSVNYSLNLVQRRNTAVLCSYIIHDLNPLLETPLSKKELQLLNWSAKIFYIGEAIHPESKSQHTFYLLTNQSVNGLSHKERLAIACVASFHSRSKLKQYIESFRHLITDDDMKNYEFMGALVKLCSSLDHSKLQVIQSIQVEQIWNQKLNFHIYHKQEAYFEKSQAEKNKKHLEKSIGKQIDLLFHRTDSEEL